MRNVWKRVLTVILLWTFAFGNSKAQETAGGISGAVTLKTGEPGVGANVQVVSETAGVVASQGADEKGLYTIANLPAGRYRLEISGDGFETDTRPITIVAGETARADVLLTLKQISDVVYVTARRVEEEVQEVPIPVSVVSGEVAENAGAFNVNRLKELIPTVQFYSTNPRNSAINIRGLGAPFGLTNDGIEPGVGLYIDGVFYARPAAATLDFLDIERLEVLRGPQGTLFGKNTTAGAVNVTTRKPDFVPGTEVEISYGNYGFVQAKSSITGPLTQKLAGRLSLSATQRGGLLYNVATQDHVNDLDNLGARGQLLFVPNSRVSINAAVDHTRQRPNGYTQVVAGIAPTLRNANRQFNQIAADLGYTPPSFNAFDRKTDVDTPLRSFQDLGGSSVTFDIELGPGRLNSTTAWRYWNWNPSNDRDFIGLAVTPVSAAPSKQRQWTQEIRYAGNISPRLNAVVGAFVFRQALNSDPSFNQEQGAAAARFLLAPSAAAATPGLLDGYGYKQFVRFRNLSAATFGQIEWNITNKLRLLPGLRFNYDQKDVDFDQQVYGGLQTNDPALIALQRSIFAPQQYKADVADNNLSGQISAAYSVEERVNAFATYATGFKSIGLNLNGLPTDAQDRPVLSAATVKPEDVRHIEFGLKTSPLPGFVANLTFFNTTVKDFQAQVVNAGVGVLRGYLANADKVHTRGIEFDGNARVDEKISLYTSAAYTDGRYVSFQDAPPPLEETGGPQSKDISGSLLPGISKWAVSYGGEYKEPGKFLARPGEYFTSIDASYRSTFSSSATASRYLVVPGYPLANVRVGFRSTDEWTVFLWARNIFDKSYYELLTAAPGNSGLIVGQPGDPRTFGLTVRKSF